MDKSFSSRKKGIYHVGQRIVLFSLLVLSLFFLTACDSNESGSGGVFEQIVNHNTLENAKPTPKPAVEKGKVTGRVLDSKSSMPIKGVSVSIPNYSAAYTNEDGDYTISGIKLTDTQEVESGKTVNITAKLEGYENLSQSITIQNSTTVESDFRLKKLYASVSGTVRDKKGLVSGATVEFGDFITTTNSEGFYSILDMGVGSSSVQITINGELKHGETLVLSSGQQRIDFNIEEGQGHSGSNITISGIVSSKNTGELLNDILVSISGYPTLIAGDYLTGTENDGYYKINGIPKGTRIITAIDTRNPPGYYDFYKSFELDKDDNSINIEMNQIPGGNITLGNIQGTITNSKGNFVAGATIIIYQKTALSDANGWFAIGDIPVGNWTITASHGTNGDFLDTVKIIEGITEINISLSK